MALCHFLLVFVAVVHGCSGLSSPTIDELKRQIDSVKNETKYINTENAAVLAKIEEEVAEFNRASSYLKQNRNLSDEHVNNTIDEVKKLLVELNTLNEKKFAINRTLYEEEQLFQRVQYGLKWLKEDLANVKERKENGDQKLCFDIDKSSMDEETKAIQARISHQVADEEFERVILEIELNKAIEGKHGAENLYKQLNIKLLQDRAIYSTVLNGLERELATVLKHENEAKEKLQSSKERLEKDKDIIKQEVEYLESEWEKLKKEVKQTKDEAAMVAAELKSYAKAIACYGKIESEAIVDLGELPDVEEQSQPDEAEEEGPEALEPHSNTAIAEPVDSDNDDDDDHDHFLPIAHNLG